MPRKAKQPSTPAPNQPYGMAGDQQAAMAQIPLPRAASPSDPGGGTQDTTGNQPMPIPGAGAAPTGAPPGMGAPAPGPPADDLDGAISAAMAMTPPQGGLFDAPTARPDEDLMTMPDPMERGRVTPTARALALMAENNGNDPGLRALAADAARKGF